jgi:peptidylamidoglycolate lyase
MAGQSVNSKRTVHNPGYELVTNWPRLPEGYELSQPGGIGIDTSQNIFVFHRPGRKWKLLEEEFPDSLISSNTILMIDRNTGKIINAWGAGLFIMPHGLTVDKLNNVWVTDVGLQQIFKFSHDGVLLMKVGREFRVMIHCISTPTDVAVAEDGSFYVRTDTEIAGLSNFQRMENIFSWGPGETNRANSTFHTLSIWMQTGTYVSQIVKTSAFRNLTAMESF